MRPGRLAFALGALVGATAVLLEESTPLTVPVLAPVGLLALLVIVVAVHRRTPLP